MSGNIQRRATVSPAQLFDADGGADGAHIGAAIRLGNGDPQHTQSTHLAYGWPIHFPLFTEFSSLWFDFLSHEVVHGFLPKPLFLAQLKIHAGS